MEYFGRKEKRSNTGKLNGNTIENLRLRLSRCITLADTQYLGKVPIYSPGPRPSAVLLDYVFKKEPERLNRISQIRKTLHCYSKSSIIFQVLPKKSLKKQYKLPFN